jgi:uncharacterized repeat protein (TIGR01451 family)
MATFYNQATLSFNGRLTNSNVTTGEILDTLSATKTAISETYGANDRVVYVINILNSGTSALTALTVTDDLGAYTLGANTLYPLDYVDGSVRYFVNGALETAPAVNPGPPLVISGINIPAGANASIIYEAQTNEFAPFESGATITNTATVTGNGTEPITVSATVTAANDTTLTIAKAICPAIVTDNGELTYTFIIQNTGNTPANATDDVIITDTFNPIINPISVTYNGAAWAEGKNYTYSETTGEFATLPGQISVPAATSVQDPATGVITVTPGVAVITVTGTV